MNEAVPKYVDRLLNRNIMKNFKMPGTVFKWTHMAFLNKYHTSGVRV